MIVPRPSVGRVVAAGCALLLAAGAAPAQQDLAYRVVISFGSACCGPDAKAMDEVRRVIIDQSRALGRPFGEKWVRWGKEGEQTLCLSFFGVDAARQERIVRRLRAALEGSQFTSLEENAACP